MSSTSKVGEHVVRDDLKLLEDSGRGTQNQIEWLTIRFLVLRSSLHLTKKKQAKGPCATCVPKTFSFYNVHLLDCLWYLVSIIVVFLHAKCCNSKNLITLFINMSKFWGCLVGRVMALSVRSEKWSVRWQHKDDPTYIGKISPSTFFD